MKRDAQTVAEELLILRCQQGDRQAPTQLVRHWQGMFRAHAWQLLRDPDAVAEVLQETWSGIFRGLHRLKDPARFRSWAYRALTHKSADWIRRQQRDRRNRATAADQMAVDTERPNENPELSRLRDELDALPAEQRALLAMVYRDGFSLTEIAEVLDIPAGTVKSRLFTLRQQLKQQLERNEQ
jgi:RNA polymerase sigma-70 factor (ECF subfamily)